MIPLPGRAYVFIGLNVVRFLSILTLILVFSSTIVVMVGDIKAIQKGPPPAPTGDSRININGTEYYYDCDYLENSTVPLQPAGAMFAIINHIFILFQCVLLVGAEIGWPGKFYDMYVPVLGREHGVGILGAIQIFIGAAVLSHHVGTFALVSAFFLFAIGILNLLLGLVFRSGVKSQRSLLTWRDRHNLGDGELPSHRAAARMADSASRVVFHHEGQSFAPVTRSIFSNVTGGTTGHGNANGPSSAKSMHSASGEEASTTAGGQGSANSNGDKPSRIQRMSGIFGRQAREKGGQYITRLQPALAKNASLPPYRSSPGKPSASRTSLEDEEDEHTEKKTWV